MYWIDDTKSNQDDLCLHGDVVVVIGDECYEKSCTVSATALFLLKTLSEDHIISESNQMLPCCGHFYIPNETNDNVYITGCPNGIDWTVLQGNEETKIITEKGTKISIDTFDYKKVVYDFTDKIQQFYSQCPPRSVPEEGFERNGYVAFWNEWARRRNDKTDDYFCPATSKKIDEGLCWEYCFAEQGGPIDTTDKLKRWIAETAKYRNLQDFHNVCKICIHCPKDI